MKLKDCTHFKVANQWFFVSAAIKENFLRAFSSHIKEALVLNGTSGRYGVSVGSLMIWPEPTKLYHPTDLAKYCVDNGFKANLEKAFDPEELKRVRAKLLIKQVKGSYNGIPFPSQT